MIIVGIDPSLTGTGIARVDTTDRLVADVTTITSKGKRDDDWPTRARRLRDLSAKIIDEALGDPLGPLVDLVVIEAPTLSQGRQGGHLDRHGLWWLILNRLHSEDTLYAVVTASARAKYATGRGNAGKDTVLLEVARRFPHVDVRTNDEADALVLAAMGADHHGTPLVDLPKTHRDALDKVAWPLNVASAGAARDLMAAAGTGVTS